MACTGREYDMTDKSGSGVRVTVNGRERRVADSTTLADLVLGMGVETTRVVVEHNGAIVSAAALEKTVVGDGDSVEIIHFVGGG